MICGSDAECVDNRLSHFQGGKDTGPLSCGARTDCYCDCHLSDTPFEQPSFHKFSPKFDVQEHYRGWRSRKYHKVCGYDQIGQESETIGLEEVL